MTPWQHDCLPVTDAFSAGSREQVQGFYSSSVAFFNKAEYSFVKLALLASSDALARTRSDAVARTTRSANLVFVMCLLASLRLARLASSRRVPSFGWRPLVRLASSFGWRPLVRLASRPVVLVHSRNYVY
ncbi:MAG: hypothetical protein MHM6MM_001490 [Cercozoa sp. M6MM]